MPLSGPGIVSLGSRRPGLTIFKTASTPIPQTIAGLKLWLKADAGTSTTSDGTGVSSWADQSGNGNNFVQATGGFQPIYKTNIVNGKPALRFDNVDDKMTSSFAQASGARTVFAAYAWKGTASTAHRVIQGSVNWLVGPYSGNHQFFQGGFVGTPPAAVANTYAIVAAWQDGAASKLYVNGTQQGAAGGAGSSPGTYGLGCAGVGSGDAADADVSEILVYDSALSSANIAIISAYFRTRFNTP